MKRRILQAIINSWYTPVFEYTQGKDFFKKILTVYNILDVFEIDKGTTVGLYGSNSANWIAIYIACLLKGIRLLVIHPNCNKLEVAHITLLTNTNHIFIDEDIVHKDLGRNVFLKTLISIDTLEVIFEKNDKSYFKVLASILVEAEKSLHTDLKVVETFFENKDIDGCVITATSGTENGMPKWVASDMNSIKSMITKASDVMPYGELDVIYSNVEFAESHYISVLLPLIKGCVFTGNSDKAEVVIEDTISMEKKWRQVASYLYNRTILSFLFRISWMKWLFRCLAVKNVKKYYRKNLKALIIYNSTINDDILRTLVKKLPLYTTYGSQETNQLVAINNFDSKEKLLPGAVGNALQGIVFSTQDDELEMSSPTIFDRYVGDEEYTREVKFKDNYVSGDVGYNNPNTNVLFVYGRKSATYYNNFKLPIQLDKLERTIKSIPYLEEAFLLPRGRKLILLVYPDINFVEAKRLGYLHLIELMKVYLHRINSNVSESTRIDDIKVLTRPLIKTQDGKICRYFYKAICFDN